MTQLKEFMLIFSYQPTNEEPSTEQLQQMQKEWGSFINGVAMQGKLVSTHRLGFEGTIISTNQTIENSIQISKGKIVSGNMILKAFSLNEATEIARKCPIFSMGGNVEVRNTIPMEL